MNFRLSIRSSLAALVAACLLPASVVALGLLAYAYHHDKEQMLESSLTTARTISYLVDKHFSNVEATLNALSTSPSLSLGDIPAFYWQAREALLTQDVANLVLTDPAGGQVMNTLRPLHTVLPPNGSSIRFNDFGDTGKAVISNLFQGEVAGRPVIAVAVPVRRSGETLYGLSAGMSPQVFETMLREQRLPAQWHSALIDRNGTIVARGRDAQSHVGRPASPALLAALDKSDEGTFKGVTATGIATYSAYKRSPLTGWTVVIGIPVEHMAGQLRQALSGLIFTIVGLFVAGLIMARLLGNRITGAITGLTAPAIALGEGKTVEVPPLPLLEADQVGRALVRASEMLEQARYQAMHDVLTGLANRALFYEIIGQQVSMANRNGTDVSVLFIDLDRFKPVNDRYGHAMGDHLLVHVAAQLRNSLRASDVAARLGGDEFAAVLIGADARYAPAVARKILDNLSSPVMLGSAQVCITASIGIASYPQDGRSVRDLLHAADEAMYKAKAAGRNQVVSAGEAHGPYSRENPPVGVVGGDAELHRD